MKNHCFARLVIFDMCKQNEAKLYLLQLHKLDKLIENKMAELEQWKAIALGTTAQMNGERVQSSGSQQKMADAVGKYVDLQREIDACIDRLVDTRNEIIGVIEQLDAMEYDVLHKLYVQRFTLQEVADICDKTYSWVTTTHGRALKNVNQILSEGKKGWLTTELSKRQEKANQNVNVVTLD